MPSKLFMHLYMIYTACPVRNVFDACRSITRASGRGLGPGNREFFGPCEMTSSRQAIAIWDPLVPLMMTINIPGKNFQCPNLQTQFSRKHAQNARFQSLKTSVLGLFCEKTGSINSGTDVLYNIHFLPYRFYD